MNVASAGKLALCICTGAVVGAGVNEARHEAKPSVSKAAKRSAAARRAIQFPCEPFIIQDQMLKEAIIPIELDPTDIPQFAGLISDPRVADIRRSRPPIGVPAPGALGLLGLGVAGLIASRKYLAGR